MIRITVPRDDLHLRIEDYKNIPCGRGGVYRIYGRGNRLLYVGKAANLRERIRQHYKGSTNTKDVSHKFRTVRLFYERDPVKRDLYETHLINTQMPPMNIEKTFTYNSKRSSSRRKAKKRKPYTFLWAVVVAFLIFALVQNPGSIHISFS